MRIIGFLEGISLIVLVGIAVPVKYALQSPAMVKAIGPVHGVLFLLFVLNAIIVAIVYKWKILTTLKVLASSLVPFGTFYVDKKILSKVEANQ